MVIKSLVIPLAAAPIIYASFLIWLSLVPKLFAAGLSANKNLTKHAIKLFPIKVALTFITAEFLLGAANAFLQSKAIATIQILTFLCFLFFAGYRARSDLKHSGKLGLNTEIGIVCAAFVLPAFLIAQTTV